MRRVSIVVFALLIELLPPASADAATVVSNSGVPSPLQTGNTALCSEGSGSIAHVNGPGSPPLGTGSLEMHTGAAANAFAVYEPLNMPAADLTAFRVAHNEPAGTPDGTFSLQISARSSPSALDNDLLFLQPPPTNGAWAMADALASTLNTAGGETTYAQYVADNPDAVVWELQVYDKTCGSTDLVVNIDDLVIGINGSNTTYDFEAPKATLTPSISATKVTAGQTVTPRVRALRAGTATPIVGETVRLYARKYPSTTFHLVTTRTTNSNGYASYPVKPLVATTYKWVLPAQDFAPVTSATKSVKVRTRLTAHVSDTSLSKTQNLILKGSTYKSRPGATVQLRRVTSTGYVIVQKLTVAGDGTYRFKHRLPSGKQHVYVHIGSGSGEIANNSPTVTVTVSG